MESKASNTNMTLLEVNDKKFSKKKYVKPYLMRRSKNRPNPKLLKQEVENYFSEIKQLRVQLAIKRSSLPRVVQATKVEIKPNPKINIISIHSMPRATGIKKQEATTKNLSVKAASCRTLRSRKSTKAPNIKIHPVSFIPKTAELVHLKRPVDKDFKMIPLAESMEITESKTKSKNIEINNIKLYENQQETKNGKLDTKKKEKRQKQHNKFDENKKDNRQKINNKLDTSKKQVKLKITEKRETNKKEELQEINNNNKLGTTQKECQLKINKEELVTSKKDKLDTNKKEDQQEINNNRLDTIQKEGQLKINNKELVTSKEVNQKEIKDKLDTNEKEDRQEIKNNRLGTIKKVDQLKINNEELDTNKKTNQKETTDKLDPSKKEDQHEINNNKLDTYTVDQQGTPIVRIEKRIRIRFGRGKGSVKRHKARSH
ncbi:hypothetical protein ILUMI_07132 [Ignelater luminosus]|uniref:Uncharacterized protein n=1 Tax=Ignelater luminosus TaxID=2038154 RepID=A0A8K0D406_IGNLU|nr:hypothetical protein ILUMI_07132 [Ignelater luminosus]